MTPRRKPRAATLPIEVDARAQPPLGMPPAEFLRDYWQKKPLLVRNAFHGLGTPMSPRCCPRSASCRVGGSTT